MLTERKPHSASRWMCTGSKYARSSMYWMCRDQDNDTAAKDICFAKELCHHADELVLEFVLLHKRCPGAPKRRHVIQKAAVEGVVVYTIYTYALRFTLSPIIFQSLLDKVGIPMFSLSFIVESNFDPKISQILMGIRPRYGKNLCLPIRYSGAQGSVQWVLLELSWKFWYPKFWVVSNIFYFHLDP